MRRFVFAFCFTICSTSSTLVLALPSPSETAKKQHADIVRSRPAATPPPVASSVPQTTRENYSDPTVVVIDAGHGGHDRGGIYGQRVSEKMVTLDVAQRLKSVLSAQGYRVVMTRDSDVFVPLGMRVAIANAYRNAIFICIHFNAARRGGANGIETYFYSRDSLPLASAIHYYVAGGAPTSNRGVRRRGYYVLRKTRVPAVLVECGFLTNPTEAQYAQSATYRQQLADEIARGIRERSLVVHPASANRYAATGTVPLQPYLDLTKVRDPDISGSKHRSKKSSKSKSAKRKKTHTSSEAQAKKRTTDESAGSAQ